MYSTPLSHFILATFKGISYSFSSSLHRGRSTTNITELNMNEVQNNNERVQETGQSLLPKAPLCMTFQYHNQRQVTRPALLPTPPLNRSPPPTAFFTPSTTHLYWFCMMHSYRPHSKIQAYTFSKHQRDAWWDETVLVWSGNGPCSGVQCRFG